MANPMLNSGPMLARGLAQSRASEPTYAALRTALAAGTYQAGQMVFCESREIDLAPLGPEMVANGGFDDGSGWGVTNVSISGGVAVLSPSANLNRSIGLMVGKQYQITYDVVSVTPGSSNIRVYCGSSGAGTARTAPGTYTETLTCAGAANLYFFTGGGFVTGTIDNVSVREVYPPQLYGDGGQGVFQIRDVGSLTDDDGVTLTGGSLAAVRVFNGPVDPIWYGMRTDGAEAGQSTAAIVAALEAGSWVRVSKPNSVIAIDDQITYSGKVLDLNGGRLLYQGDPGRWALVVNALSGSFHPTKLLNGTVACQSTDTVNRRNGVNVGGSSGVIDGVRVEGFTGVHLGLGTGENAETGETFSAASIALYWDIKNISLACTAGWGLVLGASSNANQISGLSTFVFNGLDESPPRSNNCVNDIVVSGLANTFSRISLESSPSGSRVKFLESANANVFLGAVYMENNPSWTEPGTPKVHAALQSSANVFKARHPYGADFAEDLGNGNDISTVPVYYINSTHAPPPSESPNFLVNGDFAASDLTGWSDFSVNTAITYGTAFAFGNSVILTATDGRPNLSQRLDTATLISINALAGMQLAAGAWVKTNLSDVQFRIAGFVSGVVPGDEEWHFCSSVIRPLAAATDVTLSFTTAGSNKTGYIEISNVTCRVGARPLAW